MISDFLIHCDDVITHLHQMVPVGIFVAVFRQIRYFLNFGVNNFFVALFLQRNWFIVNSSSNFASAAQCTTSITSMVLSASSGSQLVQ